jgi:hypothetical protein
MELRTMLAIASGTQCYLYDDLAMPVPFVLTYHHFLAFTVNGMAGAKVADFNALVHVIRGVQAVI